MAVRVFLFLNYYTINNDGVLYIRDARYFLQGQWEEGLASFYPPLFPLMIAAVYPIMGNWELAGQFWPAVMGVLTLFSLFGLLRRIYGVKVAKVALLFYSVSPYLARLSMEVRSEIPYLFFVVLALYCFQRALDKGNSSLIFWNGVCAALAYLIRPEGMGLMIVGVLFLLYRRWMLGNEKRVAVKIAAFILGFFLVSAPYILYLKWDTGNWLISRKTGLILSMGLAQYDDRVERVTTEESDRVSLPSLVLERPVIYLKKVFMDLFRSLALYFEALHYSYLLFLFLGWVLLFRGRFWEKKDFLLVSTVGFYLMTFALLYMTRRYGIPLAAISLGWVAVGFLFIADYCSKKWPGKGGILTMLVIVLFLAGTLPKALHAIGEDKFYLREAGVYLKEKDGNPTILTTNGRVAFYATGKNRVRIVDPKDLKDLDVSLARQEGDFLALDEETQKKFDESLKQSGWLLEREFPSGGKERLFVFRRVRA